MAKRTKDSPGVKAARTRAELYAKASADEKARIDEVRHQAAIKAAQTKKLQKKKGKSVRKTHTKADRSGIVEKAENTGKAASEITKWRISQLDSRTRWQLVEFTGKKGKESAGIVDILAIRKDHEKTVKKVGLKPGDLFEVNLIQVKGGKASWPSINDIERLQKLSRYYNVNNVVMSEWRNEQLNFYRLKKDLVLRKKSNPRDAWVKVTNPIDLFP